MLVRAVRADHEEDLLGGVVPHPPRPRRDPDDDARHGRAARARPGGAHPLVGAADAVPRQPDPGRRGPDLPAGGSRARRTRRRASSSSTATCRRSGSSGSTVPDPKLAEARGRRLGVHGARLGRAEARRHGSRAEDGGAARLPQDRRARRRPGCATSSSRTQRERRAGASTAARSGARQRVRLEGARRPRRGEAAARAGAGARAAPPGTGAAATSRPGSARRRTWATGEIALFLLENGAALDLFAAAMLGYVDVVRAMLAEHPEPPRRKGAHGIPLLVHAQQGGEQAQAVVELLEAPVIYEVFRQERAGQGVRARRLVRRARPGVRGGLRARVLRAARRVGSALGRASQRSHGDRRVRRRARAQLPPRRRLLPEGEAGEGT